MKAEDRRHSLIETLVADGSATVEHLAQQFHVSKMTIHRDLDDLEAEGLLRKVRGGATIESNGQFESDFRYRAQIAVKEKRLIAQRAAGFIEPGTSVMIDDGSTAQALVPFLLEKRPLTVITNNMVIISGLAGQAGINLVALGGTYSKKFNGFFGIVAEDAIDRLRADVALISSSAIDGTTAFHQDQEIVELKRRMIQSSARRYLMVDHKKFGRSALHFFTDLSTFDGVVTTSALSGDIKTALITHGINLHFADEELQE